MKFRTELVATVAGLATIGLLAGCSSTPASSTPANTTPSNASADSKITIGVSFDITGAFRTAEKDAITKAAEAKGDKVIFDVAGGDAQKQASQIQDLIQTQKVDAIIAIAQNADQITGSIALAKASKVPFIALDRGVTDSKDVAFQVTGDPVSDGMLAGKEALAAGGSGKLDVMQLVGALTDKNAIGRRDGFAKTVGAASNAKLETDVPMNWDPATARAGTSNALVKSPGINVIFIPSDFLLPTIVSAVKTANRFFPAGDPKHIVLVTIDGDQDGCAAVKDGTQDADIATAVGKFGILAVAAAHTAVAGKAIAKKIVTVPSVVLNAKNYATASPNVWGCNV
jgi:ABC-type sugar transport system substrate-binding protein